MQIRQTTNRGLLLSLLITASLITLTLMQRNIGAALHASEQRKYISYELAEQIRKSFDKRSSLIRSYAVTAKPEYLDHYKEFLAAKHDVQTKMLHDGEADDAQLVAIKETKEWTKLQESITLAGKLMRIEQDAIAMLDSANSSQAIEMLYSEAYSLAQADVMRSIDEFVTAVEQLAKREAERIKSRDNQLLKNYGMLLIIIMAALLIEFLSRKKKIIAPIEELTRVASHMTGGDYQQRAKTDADNEIGILASTFNEMANSIEQDIKLRKKTEEELEILRQKAEASNRAKSIFLANMSHEIRTPMNAVLGYTQLMERDSEMTSSQSGYLKVISRSGEHL
ncbi:histidine kinase dimerization/phospho-acceptor domain-containing protein, partial [Thermodesulfobacteriota bacterium]